MIKQLFLFLPLLLSASLQPPPLTGSLIAPLGEVVPYESFKIRAYTYLIAETGAYNQNWQTIDAANNFYTATEQVQCFFGLTPWCDLVFIPQVSYNYHAHDQAFHFCDLTTGLDFQLMEPGYTPYFPGIKFSVKEVFPTGNYNRLKPRKGKTDRTGFGTFSTQIELVLYEVYQLSQNYWLSTNYSAQYAIHTPVNVNGFNAYGGGFGAKGKIYPGNTFQAIIAFELACHEHWALALDTVYIHRNSTRFFGEPGISYSGTFADIGDPSSEGFSMAPAIEYNFSKHFGMIAGAWFSLFGRNSAQFRSGIINIQYTY